MEKITEKDRLGKKIVVGLYKSKMILTWYRDKPEGWILASGLWSPFYINLRLISSMDPKLYRLTGRGMCSLLDSMGFSPRNGHKVVGIAMAGIPLATAIMLLKGIPSLYTRKLPDEVKTPEEVGRYIHAHGEKALIEGSFDSGDRLVVVDDLVTRFDTKLLAISQLKHEAERVHKDIVIKDVVVLLDREQGGGEIAKKLGYKLHALIPFKSKGVDWLKSKLSKTEYDVITDYLRDPQKYQKKEVQERLKAQAKRRVQ